MIRVEGFLLHPYFRRPLSHGTAKDFLQSRGFSERHVQSLVDLQKSAGIEVAIADEEYYPHFEARLKNGTIVFIKGINPEEACKILSLPAIQDFPETIEKKYSIQVETIFVSIWRDSPEKKSAFYLHDAPIEVHLDLCSLTEDELTDAQQKLFLQLDSRNEWPVPEFNLTVACAESGGLF